MSGKAGDEPAFFIYIKTSPLKQGIISTKYDIFLNSNQPRPFRERGKWRQSPLDGKLQVRYTGTQIIGSR